MFRDFSDIINSSCFEMDISYTFGDSIDQALDTKYDI